MEVFDKKYNNCPLCKSSKIKFNFSNNKYEKNFEIYSCLQCNFIFMNPPFSDNFLKNFYIKEYYKDKNNYSYFDERDNKKFNNYVWDARVKKIHKYVKSGNFLDIGASFGGFLESASKYFTPYGIELSEYSGNHAKKIFKDNFHIGTIENHPFENNFFNVITMVEVIEHMKNPVNFLEKCYDLLKKDGVLVIQTANMEAWQAVKTGKDFHYYLPGHLSYFSETNLKSLLKSIGFEKIITFSPVDFGLLPKLKKSRGNFKKISDYIQWYRISRYHFKSFFKVKNRRCTSSMVIYAFK